MLRCRSWKMTSKLLLSTSSKKLLSDGRFRRIWWTKRKLTQVERIRFFGNSSSKAIVYVCARTSRGTQLFLPTIVKRLQWKHRRKKNMWNSETQKGISHIWPFENETKISSNTGENYRNIFGQRRDRFPGAYYSQGIRSISEYFWKEYWILYITYIVFL